jgi:hypothetical protein
VPPPLPSPLKMDPSDLNPESSEIIYRKPKDLPFLSDLELNGAYLNITCEADRILVAPPFELNLCIFLDINNSVWNFDTNSQELVITLMERKLFEIMGNIEASFQTDYHNTTSMNFSVCCCINKEIEYLIFRESIFKDTNFAFPFSKQLEILAKNFSTVIKKCYMGQPEKNVLQILNAEIFSKIVKVNVKNCDNGFFKLIVITPGNFDLEIPPNSDYSVSERNS